MKIGTVQLPTSQVGEKRAPFKPADSTRVFHFIDLLFPGDRVQVAVTSDQYNALAEGQVIKATCALDKNQKGLRLMLETYEVIQTSKPANGATPREVAAARV